MNLSLASSNTGKDYTVNQLLRPLTPYLDDETVTDITINQPGELWAYTPPDGWKPHVMGMLNWEYLLALCNAITVFNGMSLQSINSVMLPTGERVQIVLPPACIDGTLSFMIRKHSTSIKTLDELSMEGAFTVIHDVSFNQPVFDENQACDLTSLQAFEIDLLKAKSRGEIAKSRNLSVYNIFYINPEKLHLQGAH